MFNMSNSREWDVTVRGRIENVTDRDAFPGMLQAALGTEPEISIVQFDFPTWPHTTAVVIRISAIRKRDAEEIAREIILRLYLDVAREIVGNEAFGWTMSVDAVPSTNSTPK
ncbi:MAG: hypothetical protein HKL86_00825 [Acidimicrobiaceae bacterium]|nr:hypothetical protein [Acidimicrobiaceae bacterium]